MPIGGFCSSFNCLRLPVMDRDCFADVTDESPVPGFIAKQGKDLSAIFGLKQGRNLNKEKFSHHLLIKVVNYFPIFVILPTTSVNFLLGKAHKGNGHGKCFI